MDAKITEVRALLHRALVLIDEIEGSGNNLMERGRHDQASDGLTSNQAISDGVAASWEDPEVRRRRSLRHGCVVDGKAYRNFRTAFEELGLEKPGDNKHIAFRTMVAKLEGEPFLDKAGREWRAIEITGLRDESWATEFGGLVA